MVVGKFRKILIYIGFYFITVCDIPNFECVIPRSFVCDTPRMRV